MIRGIAIAALLIVATSLRADPPRVLTEKPQDARLLTHNHVDKPFEFHANYASKEAWEARRDALRRQILVANGLWPMPERTPLGPVIHGKIDRDEYTIEKVYFQSMPGHYVTGNLYRPKGKSGKLPAVLCPHGHWNNGRLYENSAANAKKEVDAGAENTIESATYPLQARCAMLARLGCVVFFYDMVGYADSFPIAHRTGFTDVEAELRGQTFMGLQTWNSIRALDFLSWLEDVDPKRIAVTGASGGGTQTMLLGAIDDRPAVVVPAVMVSANMQGGCICENSSHLRVETNNIEFAALFAPKPQAITAANDWTRDVEFRGVPDIQRIYKLYGADKLFAAKYFPFGHNYNQRSREFMYGFVNEHLKLGHKAPIAERPFVPVPPKELSVWDEQHPKPADFADAPGLRKTMTQASEAQMKKMADDPTAFRKTIEGYVQTTIGTLPAAGDVLVSRASGPITAAGCRLETSTLSRRGFDQQVPFTILMPERWSGTVTIWAHDAGKAALFDAAGAPTATVQKLLARGHAVASADLFQSGELIGAIPGEAGYSKQTYAGFRFGYNRSTLAHRSRDLLALVSLAKNWQGTKQVHLIAEGKMGVAGLLAKAAAPAALDQATIDLHGFDFDQLKAADDPMMLSGVLRFGGVWAIATLCEGATLLNPPATPRHPLVEKTPGLKVSEKKSVAEAIGEP